MPNPPLIQNPVAQRAVVALVMGAMFATSLAAAYTLSHKKIGSPGVNSVDRWQQIAPAPEVWTKLLPSPEVFRDIHRSSRTLVHSFGPFENPIAPHDAMDRLVKRIVASPSTLISRGTGIHRETGLAIYELVLLENADTDAIPGPIQHLFAIIASPQDGQLQAMIYLRDHVASDAVFNENIQLFHGLYQSIHIQSDSPNE